MKLDRISFNQLNGDGTFHLEAIYMDENGNVVVDNFSFTTSAKLKKFLKDAIKSMDDQFQEELVEEEEVDDEE